MTQKYQLKRVYVNIMMMALLVVMLVGTAVKTHAQEQQGENPIVLQPDRTMDNLENLPAGAAKRDDAIKISNYGWPKYYWLQNFGERTTDTLEWTVQSDLSEEAEYYAWMRICATKGTEFELVVTQDDQVYDTAEFVHLNDGYSYTRAAWAYDEAGTVRIPSGVSTITFRMKSGESSQKCQVYGLDMIRNSDKEAYEGRIASFRASSQATLDRLRNQDYGYFFQYGVWGYPEHGDRKDMETATNDFDVESFVQFLEDTGAKSVIWSITWWEYRMQMKVNALDEIMGNTDFTTERDLIPEIAAACKAKGIDFYLYYHQGLQQQPEWKEKQDFPEEYNKYGTGDRSVFFDNWKKVVGEIGTRLGDNLDGWFFDDASVYYGAPFESLAQAAKTGNSARLISYNGWIGPKVTEFADMAFNEGEWGNLSQQPDSVVKDGILQNGKEKGQLYVGMPIATQNNWGIYNPEEKIVLSVSTDYMIERVKATHAQKIPMLINLSMWEDGSIGETVVDGLMKLKAAMNGDEESETINDTDSKIAYTSGEWEIKQDSSNTFIGSTYHRSTDFENSPTVEMTFTGVGIEVYGAQANWSSNCEVYVDGEHAGSGDFTVSDSSYQYVHMGFSKTDLEYGEHTIKLVYSKNSASVSEVAFDAFKVIKRSIEKPTYPAKKIVLSGSSTVPLMSKNTFTASLRPQYTTDSKEIVWTVTDAGGAPTKLAEIDQTGLLKTYKREGTVKVRAESVANPEIFAEKIIDIKESINVTEIPGLDNRVIQNPKWQSSEGKRMIYTTDGDCTATLDFEGYCVEWYGTTSVDHGIADVYIDGELAETVDCYTETRADNIRVFCSENLGGGSHTIEIRTKGTHNADGRNTFIEIYKFKIYNEVKLADATELNKAITEAERMLSDLDKYIDDKTAKDNLSKTVNTAKEVLANYEASQTEIDQAVTDLRTAMGALRLPADTTGLEQMLKQLKAVDLGKYTEQSAAAVRTAIEKAEKLLAQPLDRDDQLLINEIVKEMEDALAKLAPVEPGKKPADTTGLEQMLKQLKAVDLGKYTEESAAAVRTAIEKAERLLAQDLKEEDQNQINGIVSEMEKALAQLVLKQPAEKPDDQKPGDQKPGGQEPGDQKPVEKITAAQVTANSSKMNAKLKAVWSGSKISLTWAKVSGADGYDIYAEKYGKSITKKSLAKTIKTGKTVSAKITKIGGKKLSKTASYKIQVRAYRKINGKKTYIAKSLYLYPVNSSNKTYTNVKKLTASKKAYTLKKGKNKTVSVKITKSDKKKKLLPSKHVAQLRYWSSNTKVASVNAKGKITAKGKGTCYIYIAAANGVNTRVKVTVK